MLSRPISISKKVTETQFWPSHSLS